MPVSITILAHATAFLAYGTFVIYLSVVMVPTWFKTFFMGAAGLTALWAATVLGGEVWSVPPEVSDTVGALRDGGWYAVVLVILHSQDRSRILWRGLLVAVLFIVVTHAVFTATDISAGSLLSVEFDSSVTAILEVIIGLILLENMLRNLAPDQLWALKHLGIGLVAISLYQLLTRIPPLLTHTTPIELVVAKPLIFVLALPLFAVTATRYSGLNARFHATRRIVFHAATLIVIGLVLQGAAIAALYLHTVGGSNGVVLSIVLGFVSIVGITVATASGAIRSRLKAFIAENFFKYKYDYRLEWNKFIRALSANEEGDMPLRALRTLAEILDSNGGMLWVRRESWHEFVPAASWSAPREFGPIALDDPCVGAFDDEDISYLELAADAPLVAPWRARFPEAWLAVPLYYRGTLIGIALLNKTRVARKLDWEDKNLISVVSLQVAAYLYQEETAQALADARQLQEFNKRFAFILHDTKNAVGQLSLLVRNVDEFGHLEEFRADMAVTLRNSVERLQKLLAQLRVGQNEDLKRIPRESVDLMGLVSGFVCEKRKLGFDLVLNESEMPVTVGLSNKEVLLSVLELVVSNALDVTGKGSVVKLDLAQMDGAIHINISDNGPGMTQEFITDQLFRPLRTTKGDGYGIGAYQAREMMRDLGGSINVRSRLGDGTTVTLSLPITITQKETVLAR